MAKGYWLMKSEPDVFSIDDLAKVEREPWDGIRNYQARNFMRDTMRVGDGVLFYHSNGGKLGTGIVGVADVVSEGYADYTAWDAESKYFDGKASEANPIWVMVDVRFVEKFDEILTLSDLKGNAELSGMLVVRRGQRLSIQPVDEEDFARVLKLGRGKG